MPSEWLSAAQTLGVLIAIFAAWRNWHQDRAKDLVAAVFEDARFEKIVGEIAFRATQARLDLSMSKLESRVSEEMAQAVRNEMMLTMNSEYIPRREQTILNVAIEARLNVIERKIEAQPLELERVMRTVLGDFIRPSGHSGRQ